MLAMEEPATILKQDPQEALALYAQLCSGGVRIAGKSGREQDLPTSLAAFLRQLQSELRAGSAVSIQQSGATLTSMEAAKALGVSRQFLVQLLEQGRIPFHKVGTHRRVYSSDLLAYKAERDATRHDLLNQLVLAEIEDGTYDSIAIDASLPE